MAKSLLCSRCFEDQGLKVDADKIGTDDNAPCPNCGARDGRKLDAPGIEALAHRFFVRGTVHRVTYGAAPILQFNEQHAGADEIELSEPLRKDVRLISRAINIGLFRYAPRLWMVGEIEPLKALQSASERQGPIGRMLTEYPTRELSAAETFYRLRVNPEQPADAHEYDSPPAKLTGRGRLDRRGYPVMYGSQDLEVCIHECRATVDDALFVATISPLRSLRLLDLSAHIKDSPTEFESLDLTVHMLFLAGSHSYEICREITSAACEAGFDGVIYPSYFSLVRTGAMPLETIFGISVRQLPSQKEYVKSQIISNVALFGRPLEAGLVRVTCINRVVLNRAAYDISFGPVAP